MQQLKLEYRLQTLTARNHIKLFKKRLPAELRKASQHLLFTLRGLLLFTSVTSFTLALCLYNILFCVNSFAIVYFTILDSQHQSWQIPVALKKQHTHRWKMAVTRKTAEMSLSLGILQQYDTIVKNSSTVWNSRFMLYCSTIFLFSRAVNLDVSWTESEHHSIVKNENSWSGSSSLPWFLCFLYITILLQLTERSPVIASPFCISYRLNWVEKFSCTACTEHTTIAEFSNVAAAMFETIQKSGNELLPTHKILFPSYISGRKRNFYFFNVTHTTKRFWLHWMLSRLVHKFRSHWLDVYFFINVCKPQLFL